MLNSINIGQYIPGNSLLHRSDPRTKILLTFAFLTVVLTVDSFIGFLIGSVFVVLAVVSTKIGFKRVLKGMKPIMFLVLFTAVINLLSTPGRVLFSVWILNVTYEGFVLATKMAWRLLLLISGASLLTYVTTPTVLTDGIENLLSPLKKIKVPVHEFAMMMTIALRFIPTLIEETDKIIKAQTARGADFDTGGLIKKVKAFLPIIIPLLISSFMRANELATAMEARCYKGGEGRTRMKELKFSVNDLKLVTIFIIFVIMEISIKLIF